MSPNSAPIDGIGTSAAWQAAAAQKASAPPGAKFPSLTNPGAVPASPPPEVLEAMGHASRVHDDLRAQGRELHFEREPGGRIVVQVRDLEDHVLRTIPPSHALDLASGHATG